MQALEATLAASSQARIKQEPGKSQADRVQQEGSTSHRAVNTRQLTQSEHFMLIVDCGVDIIQLVEAASTMKRLHSAALSLSNALLCRWG